jgi:hypothetical protein
MFVMSGCGGPTVSEEVIDDVPGSTWNGSYPIKISPDWESILIWHMRRDRWGFFLNGTSIGEGDFESFVWSPDGKYYAYLNKQKHLIIGGQDVGQFADYRLALSGQRWAVLGRRPHHAAWILLLNNGAERTVRNVDGIAFNQAGNLLCRRGALWFDGDGQRATPPEVPEISSKQRVVTPRWSYREASIPPLPGHTTVPARSSAGTTTLRLQLKVKKSLSRPHHQLYVNDELIGEYVEILQRRIPNANRSEWCRIGGDGTIVLYAICRDGKIHRIRIRQ